MALLPRLPIHQLIFKVITKNERLTILTRRITIKSYNARAKCLNESYDERNMKLGRPQSPHLTIYAPQLTSLLSITHRFTGVILAGYAMCLALAAVALPHSLAYYLDTLEALHIGAPVIFIGKFSLSEPFCYHLCNGIRHLVWDTGSLLTIKGVYITGYIMLLTSTGAAVGLACL